MCARVCVCVCVCVQTIFDNPYIFYAHVGNHVETYADGKGVECQCMWTGEFSSHTPLPPSVQPFPVYSVKIQGVWDDQSSGLPSTLLLSFDVLVALPNSFLAMQIE